MDPIGLFVGCYCCRSDLPLYHSQLSQSKLQANSQSNLDQSQQHSYSPYSSSLDLYFNSSAKYSKLRFQLACDCSQYLSTSLIRHVPIPFFSTKHHQVYTSTKNNFDQDKTALFETVMMYPDGPARGDAGRKNGCGSNAFGDTSTKFANFVTTRQCLQALKALHHHHHHHRCDKFPLSLYNTPFVSLKNLVPCRRPAYKPVRVFRRYLFPNFSMKSVKTRAQSPEEETAILFQLDHSGRR